MLCHVRGSRSCGSSLKIRIRRIFEWSVLHGKIIDILKFFCKPWVFFIVCQHLDFGFEKTISPHTSFLHFLSFEQHWTSRRKLFINYSRIHCCNLNKSSKFTFDDQKKLYGDRDQIKEEICRLHGNKIDPGLYMEIHLGQKSNRKKELYDSNINLVENRGMKINVKKGKLLLFSRNGLSVFTSQIRFWFQIP